MLFFSEFVRSCESVDLSLWIDEEDLVVEEKGKWACRGGKRGGRKRVGNDV